MIRIQRYIDNVLSEKIVTGELIKKSCLRHEKLKKDSRYYFDEKSAANIIKLAENCRHWKGSEFAGKNFKLEDWQCFYLGSIFGWKVKETGLRKYKTSYLEVARKNGKTTISGVTTLGHILLDKEPGSQVYFAATKEEQAKIGFEDTKNIIKGTPILGKYFQLFQKSIMHNLSTVKPLGSDSRTQDGFDPSWAVIDEYHAHKTAKMLDILESGMGARRQPHTQIITTAGFDSHSPCYNLRETAIQILDETLIDESFFIMIFSLDAGDKWDDEKTWIKCNPNLNISVKLDFIKTRLQQAKNEGGSKEVDFKTKNLNIWTDSSEAWISQDKMERNYAIVKYNDYLGKKCTAGFDLAKGVDINAFVLLFEDGAVLPYFLIPENKLKNNRDGVDYKRWLDLGFLNTCPGDIIDHDYIADYFVKVTTDFEVEYVGYDKYLSYHGLIQKLLQSGYDNLVPVQQGFLSLSAPTKEIESDLTAGKLKIENEVLKWMFGNVKIETDPAGNIKPSKSKSEKKIDGVAALINAKYVKMASNNTIYEKSIYDNEDFDLILL